MKSVLLNEKLKQSYNEYYCGESETEWRQLGAIDKAHNITNACKAIPHDTIVEIGAGEGSLLQELADRKFGKELYALEISESGVDVIRKRCIEEIKEVQLFDGYSIPYDDNRFDLAILSHVVEHLEFPRLLIREAGRVARHVFIEVPLEDTVRGPKDFKITRTGHINFYSYKNIRKLVQSSGFDCACQELSNLSFAVHKYLYGNKALFKYAVREVFLRLAPRIARIFFVYNCHLLLKRNSSKMQKIR